MSATQEQTDITVISDQEFSAPAAPNQAQQFGDIMLNSELMNQAMVIADNMANSKVSVPDHLKNNVGDCYAIVLQSLQWRMNPYVVAQKTHIVSGKLGYEAQLINALVQASGYVSGLPKYEYKGEGNNLECRVGFKLKNETEISWGQWLKFSSVTVKNSPLWKTNVPQQLGYLQIKNWARAFMPQVILGIYTEDELQDQPISNEPKDITPESGGRAELEPYPDDRFKENLDSWRLLIEAGKKSADDIIKMLSTKAVLSDEQLQQIRDLETGENNENT